MKKLLAFMLVLALCLSLCTGLTACVQKESGSSSSSSADIEAALEYVKTLYRKPAEKTSRDFTRIGAVPVNGKTYEVVWSVDVAEEHVKVVKNADGSVTIDVNETSAEEVPYTLTATIKDGDKVVSFSWKHIVPKVNLDFGAIVDEAYALEQGASMDREVTLTGVINKVDTPYDEGYKNITVTMDVIGVEGKPIQCYRLKGEGAENLKPGDTITVAGTLTNYQGKIQFNAGCQLLSVTSAGEVEAPTDVETIMKEAFELADGGSTKYQATLTGKITKINTPYNPSYKNVSVTIAIEGYEGKELLCYRIKGEGADSLLIGDTITVKGYIVNYKGSVQFGEGSALLKVEKTGSEVKAPSDPKQIVKEAYELKEDETLPYKATLTGKITKIDTPYSPAFGNITVTIVVSGMTDKPIKVYRLAGAGVENVDFGVGDTITVTGQITNYKGEVEFAQGCTLDKWENTVKDTIKELTVKEAIDLALSTEHNVYSEKKYKVTGTITEVYDAAYGNMKISDAQGNILTIYGSYSSDGSTAYKDMASKPVAGDVVTIMGPVGNYNGTPQIKDGWILSFETPKMPSYAELGLPATDGAEITIEQALAAGKKIPIGMYTENKYKVTGVITEVKQTTYGNLYIEDAEGNTLYIYGTFNADGSKKYGEMDVKPIVGDTITVLGILGNYKGDAQMKNGWILEHKVPEIQLEVSFDLNYDDAGEAPASFKVNPNTAYGELPPAPTREGYTFGGWFLTKACDGEAVTASTEVTQSHTLYAKWIENSAAPETGLVAGKPYIFGMTQGNLGNKVYYLAGGMAQTFYLATTEDANAAINVYVEETEGGYYFYTTDGETKLYINMVVNDTHVNGVYEATASTVYTYDAEHNTLIAEVNGEDYWIGTRNDRNYTTMGPNKVSFNGFYGEFYPVTEEEPDPDPVMYEVTFDLNGAEGTAPTAIQVESGKAYGELPPAPTREGYTFEGWFLTKACDGEAVTESTEVTQSHTLYAKWIENAAHTHEYTVTTTATCTEAGVTTYTCKCGDTYSEETEKLGHIDENLDIECDREGCTSKVAPTANSLLSNFTANRLGSLLSTDNLYYVEGVIVEVLDQKNGIFLIDDGTGEKFYFRLPKNAEGVSHANWEIKLTLGDKVSVYGKINKYSASSAPNGQFWPAMQGPVVTLLEQHTHDFTAVPATCSKPAYCACGQSHGDPLGCADTNGDSLCDDCGKNVNYTFEYVEIRTDNNSGVVDTTAGTYTWGSDNFGVQVVKGTSSQLYTTSKDHMRLYSGNKLVLTSKNGKAVKMIVVYLTNATQVGNFEKFLTGYTYTKDEEAFTVTVEVDFTETLTLTNPGSSTQIKGVEFGYEKTGETPDPDPVMYEVTFDLNGAEGTAPSAIQVEAGKAYGDQLPPAPTREGYTFGGWFLTKACDGEAVTASTEVTQSHTLYAKWTRNVARVFFNLNYTGATGGPDFITVNVGEAYGDQLPPAPTREGYTFEGWALEDGTVVDASTTVSADHTLYAKWTENTPAPVEGGSADFSAFNITTPSGGDGQYINTYTTANGWTTVYSAIQVGGASDANPVFKAIGPDNTHKAVCLNGRTSQIGKLTSPTLNTGISKLTVKYTKMFTDTKLSVTVTVKDAAGNAYTHVIENLNMDRNEKGTAYTDEWTLKNPIVGDFTIEVVNNCPSNSSSSNKDRFTILSLAWEGAAGAGGSGSGSEGEGGEGEGEGSGTTTPTLPNEDGAAVSIADVLAVGATMEHNTYTTLKYKVTGVITQVYNTQYGNMYIEDAEGNKLTIYGTYNADGTVRYDAMDVKPVAGDTVTIYGPVGQYSGTPQIKNGWIVAHTVGTPPVQPDVPELPTEDGAEVSIADALLVGATMEHNTYTTLKYNVTGVITEVYNTQYGNMYIQDAEGNKLTIYGTYSADGSARYDAMDVKPVAGDTVTIYGAIGCFNGTPQIKNGWIVEHTSATPSTPSTPSTPEHVEPSSVSYAYGSYDSYTKVVKNWGYRGDVATSLSPLASAFYTGTDTYVELAKLSGSSTLSSVPQSELYTALQLLMASKHTKLTSYGDTRYLYGFTDCEGTNSSTLSTFYSGSTISSTWDNGETWNREHCWPKSKTVEDPDRVNNSDTGVNADIVTLRPTLKSVNSGRSNNAYGSSSSYYFPNQHVGSTGYDLRGDCARVVLFTYVRWGETNLTDVIESVDLLLSWIQADPVDTWELARNDSVQSITGTRNVFVDYPQLAFILFGEEVPASLTVPSAS